MREQLFSGWDRESVLPEDIRSVLRDAIGASNELKRVESSQLLLSELDSKGIASDT